MFQALLRRRLTALLSLVVVTLAFSPAGLGADEGGVADDLGLLLETSEVSCGQAAWFTLEAAGVEWRGEARDAFTFARDQNWLPVAAKEAAPVRLDWFCRLLMGAFGFKGGFFYSMFPNPHYAYRELVYQGMILGMSYPAMRLSGGDFLLILGRVLTLIEETEESGGVS